ncbi:sodium-dependent transporter [uncultured Methanobrevibacter sp.]|uniref:sodium-dependent transporter n=1 Tax=uncultured Methanobrevibacter sp. TaxID=253161 RepID=UPI0025CCE52F|nr:sodium-dependent transporter [uncultured Methanobrevibacter sp.]
MSSENQWGSPLSFVFAMIGSAVGLGNIWRYPYVLYSSGGGAFFIPYIIAILVMGIPVLIMEYGIGLKFRSSFTKAITKIDSRWQFLGWLIPVSLLMIMIYYSSILGIDFIYVFLSFFKSWGANPGFYFEHTLMQSSDSFMGILNFIPILAIAILIGWILVWFISHKDLESGLGKVSKIFVPLLFLIMIGIVIFSLTLPGASIGLSELYNPDWSLLFNFNVWMLAFGQIIFSLNIGLSGTVTFAGYLKEDVDIISNTFIIALANSIFENIAAIGVFSILGYMSLQTSTPVPNLIDQGTGLIFVTYPTILNILGQWAYVIGPLFFITIYIAGITSILSMIEPISFSIQNKFSISRKRTVTILCIIGAFASMVFATSFGGALLEDIDSYVNQISGLFCIVLECILFAWIYKAENLVDFLNSRSKHIKIGRTWLLIVKFVLPFFIMIIWIGGMSSVFNEYSQDKTIITISTALLLFAVSLYLTLKKPTNPEWDEVNERV